MEQLSLPLKLKCINPGCTQEAPRYEYFCSESCHHTVRVAQLASQVTWGERRAMFVTAFLAGLMLAAASLA